MPTSLHFAEYTLDREARRLLRGTEPVALRPQCMDVLVYLAERAGTLVEKEALLDAVWPGRVVTDDSISHCIADIRAALEDRDREKIRTVPRRGFVFQLPVKERPAETAIAQEFRPQPKAGTTRPPVSWLGLALGLLFVVLLIAAFQNRAGRGGGAIEPEATANGRATTAPVTLAVLPFTDLSAAQDQAHMADGLTEELIMELVQVEGLLVSGRTSSSRFRERPTDLRDIGEALGVAHLLTGSVRRFDGRLRISAQLVELESGFSLWSDSYDRPLTDFFAIQDEIAEAVTAALRITLGLGGWNNPYATDSIAAYELVRQAKGLFFTDPESTQRGLEKLRQAVELDPDYGFAWGELAAAYALLGEVASPDWRSTSETMIQRSIELNPDSSWPLYNAAQIYGRLGDFGRAGELLRQAEHHSDLLLFLPRIDFSLKVGQAESALELARRAVRRDPLCAMTRMYHAHALANTGQLEASLEEWSEAAALQEHGALLVEQGLMAALSLGEEGTIREWLARSRAANPGFTSYDILELQLDAPEAARASLQSAWSDPDIGAAERWQLLNFAAYMGETELAMDILDVQSDTWPVWMDHFADVRRTDRFHDWVVQQGIVSYWRDHGWADQCEPLDGQAFRCR